MRDLEEVLKTLKPNKARDPEGIDRTIFGTNIIRTNLKKISSENVQFYEDSQNGP